MNIKIEMYKDEIKHKNTFENRQNKTPEEILLEKEYEHISEKIERKQEIIQQYARQVFFEKIKIVLTNKEKNFLYKLLFDIDKYYPEKENQTAVAEKIGITRENFIILNHRIKEKINKNTHIKQKCKKIMREKIASEKRKIRKSAKDWEEKGVIEEQLKKICFL